VIGRGPMDTKNCPHLMRIVVTRKRSR